MAGVTEDDASVYTSEFTATDSVASETEYAEPYDVALIYSINSNLGVPVSKAIAILKNDGYNVRDSIQHSLIAGEPKTSQTFEQCMPAQYRLVIFNKAYKKHDLPFHGPMLYNRKKTTRHNTLILMRKKHHKLLPIELQDLECHQLENITGSDIAAAASDFIKSRENGEGASLDIYEDHHKIFKNIVDGFDSKRSFILIVNIPQHPVPACTQHLAKVPWLKVFDFSYKTRENGLLGMVKPYLSPGKFTISTTDNPPKTPNDHFTDWTVWVQTEKETNDEDIMDDHVKLISQYCSGQKVATLIILWYDKDNQLDFDLYDLTFLIKNAFKSNRGIKIVLFSDKTPEHGTVLSNITKGSNRDESRLIVPLSIFMGWLREETIDRSGDDNNTEFLLPSYKRNDGHDAMVTLSKRHYNWLSADMDVLTTSSNASTIEYDDAEGINFLQGGTISWNTIADGRFDGRRGVTEDILSYIKREHIERGISGPVYIHHHPGSGGTTLGRRVLWEMRNIVPCMAVHPPFEDTEEFREKVKFIQNHTNRTVFLLMDGAADIQKILTALSYMNVVILNVVRYYGSMENKYNSSGHYYLKDEITKRESAQIVPIYSKFGKKSCAELESRWGGEKIHMYEYGLTAFNENFFGVRGYVRGHLRQESEMQPWHRVVGFLALALHYGQKMLPCELFSNLLEVKQNSIVKKKHIPFHGRQLIKEEGDKWSIRYAEVAREILKQLLIRDGEPCPTESRTLDLSGEACRELKNLAISFIEEMKASLSDSDEIPRHKLIILREVFITRNEFTEIQDKSLRYSMILRDVYENKYRGDILKKLTECFPKHADFHAHLGRYYGKSSMYEEAEESLKMAINVRMDELALHHRFQEGDEVSQRVHHMLGFFYFNRIPENVGPSDSVTEGDILGIIEFANKAINKYQESTKYFVVGTNPTYSLLGNVKVRLRVSKIAKELNLLGQSGAQLSFTYLVKLRNFCLESFGICDGLLAQCIEQATDHEIRNSEFNYCTEQLMDLFEQNFSSLMGWTETSTTLASKLCKIAILKKKIWGRKSIYSMFNVDKREELLDLRELYEAVIRGSKDNKNRISTEMLDWLKIIRLTDAPCDLQTALEFVEFWERRNEKNSLSTYYLYILNIVMAIDFPGESMRKMYRKKAETLREKLETSEKPVARHILFRQFEWLGHSANLKMNTLIHRDMFDPKHDSKAKLRWFTGTITAVKKWYGWLNIDRYSDPVIKVFFSPQKYEITSQDARENARVRFTISFSPRYGAQASNIESIETRRCSCGNITEIGTNQNYMRARCKVCGKEFK